MKNYGIDWLLELYRNIVVFEGYFFTFFFQFETFWYGFLQNFMQNGAVKFDFSLKKSENIILESVLISTRKKPFFFFLKGINILCQNLVKIESIAVILKESYKYLSKFYPIV